MKKLLIVLCVVVLSFVMTAGAWLPEAYATQSSEFDVTQLIGKNIYEICDLVDNAGYYYVIPSIKKDARPQDLLAAPFGGGGYLDEDFLWIYSPDDLVHPILYYAIARNEAGEFIDFDKYIYNYVSISGYGQISPEIDMIPLPKDCLKTATVAELKDFAERNGYRVEIEDGYYDHFSVILTSESLEYEYYGIKTEDVAAKDDDSCYLFEIRGVEPVSVCNHQYHYVESTLEYDAHYEVYVCSICGAETSNFRYFTSYEQLDNTSHKAKCDYCSAEFIMYHEYYGDSNSCTKCGYTAEPHYHLYSSVYSSSYGHKNICEVCGKCQDSAEYPHTIEKYIITEEGHHRYCDVCKHDYCDYKHSFLFDKCIWCGYVRGTEIPKILGDLNSSGGDPDVLDGVVMQRILASLEPEITAADLNHDGIVNVADGVVMQRILAGLE